MTPGLTLIQTRHVFYVEGYDPQGAKGYYRLFQQELKRFTTLWSVESRLGTIELTSENIAQWNVETRGPNWRVVTHYEFLRLERFIAGNMAQPLIRQFNRTAWWMFDDLKTGTLLRIFRAWWRFGVHLAYPQVMLILWAAAAFAGGWLAMLLATRYAGVQSAAAFVIALAVGLALFAALRPLADRWFILQIANCWPYLREFASGSVSGYDQPIDIFAERIVAAARANDADEIVIIGHSAGGVIGPAVLARALQLDPELGRRGPRVMLMTLGSLLPAVTLHPAAERMRAAICQLAIEPSLLWIDCQSHKDWLSFSNFDVIKASGIHLDQKQFNPRIWRVRFRDMLSAANMRRLQWNLFRMHFQFIMANDTHAPYDYFMLLCGPAAASDWATHSHDVLTAFSKNAAYVEHRPVVAAHHAKNGSGSHESAAHH